jgi:hypothetical protein
VPVGKGPRESAKQAQEKEAIAVQEGARLQQEARKAARPEAEAREKEAPLLKQEALVKQGRAALVQEAAQAEGEKSHAQKHAPVFAMKGNVLFGKKWTLV